MCRKSCSTWHTVILRHRHSCILYITDVSNMLLHFTYVIRVVLPDKTFFTRPLRLGYQMLTLCVIYVIKSTTRKLKKVTEKFKMNTLKMFPDNTHMTWNNNILLPRLPISATAQLFFHISNKTALSKWGCIKGSQAFFISECNIATLKSSSTGHLERKAKRLDDFTWTVEAIQASHVHIPFSLNSVRTKNDLIPPHGQFLRSLLEVRSPR